MRKPDHGCDRNSPEDMGQPLAINGLLMPPDFPTAAFERAYARARRKASASTVLYDHFSAAWNAISFRYLDLCAEGDGFTASITAPPGVASFEQRYRQERHLFGFFSTGFSAFEAYFYGMFAIGGMLQPSDFPLSSPKEQQAVSPASANRTYERAFPGDPILNTFQSIFADVAYREWKEVRNVLTHRTAPGRTIFVSIGSDEDLPPRWKINNIVLDESTAASRRTHASRMLGTLLNAAADFIESHVV